LKQGLIALIVPERGIEALWIIKKIRLMVVEGTLGELSWQTRVSCRVLSAKEREQK
jgi:hypothetical protein